MTQIHLPRSIVKMPGKARHAMGVVVFQENAGNHDGFSVTLAGRSYDACVPERQVAYVEARAGASEALKASFLSAAVLVTSIIASKAFVLPSSVGEVALVCAASWALVGSVSLLKKGIEYHKIRKQLVEGARKLPKRSIEHSILEKRHVAAQEDCKCMQAFLKRGAMVTAALPISGFTGAALGVCGGLSLFAKIYRGHRKIRRAEDAIVIAACAEDLKEDRKQDQRPFNGVLEDRADEITAYHERMKKRLVVKKWKNKTL